VDRVRGAPDGVALFRSDPIAKEKSHGHHRLDRAPSHRRVYREHLTGRRAGLLTATVVGVIGALLGGFLAKALFHA
jgi:hypothetical protein